MKTIHQIKAIPTLEKITRVAAYARVSCGKDEMLHSLSAQVSYYSNLIQNHPGWSYAGVYADEAITGTKEERENFQRLISDCKAGKIDMVITKSISRFARNTVTLLETVRKFKSIGIDVFFEEQNIHTMSSDGELIGSATMRYDYDFKGIVYCGCCGWRYRRKKNYKKYVWKCGAFTLEGREGCTAKQIPDSILHELAEDCKKEIEKIIILPDNNVKFIFTDKSEIIKRWVQPSRADSWTDEMKENARLKTKERNMRNAENNQN